MGDYQPLSESYYEHWKDRPFEEVKQEAAKQLLSLNSESLQV
jgi:hypothetical protein